MTDMVKFEKFTPFSLGRKEGAPGPSFWSLVAVNGGDKLLQAVLRTLAEERGTFRLYGFRLVAKEGEKVDDLMELFAAEWRKRQPYVSANRDNPFNLGKLY